MMMKPTSIFFATAALAAVVAAQSGSTSLGGALPANPAPQTAQPATAASAATPQQPIAQEKVQAQTKAEYDAYVAADKVVSKGSDLSKGEQAAANFQQKFPQSRLTPILYDKLMKRYQEENNTADALAMARKELALDPKSVPALLTAASVLGESAHDEDANFAQEYTETLQDANTALKLMQTGAFNPPGLSPEQMDSLKAIGYSAIGNIEFVRSGNENAPPAERAQADANAEQALRQATQLNTLDPDPAEWLRLAVTLDHEKKYIEALPAAERAVSLAGSDANVLALAQQEQTRLRELTGTAATSPMSH